MSKPPFLFSFYLERAVDERFIQVDHNALLPVVGYDHLWQEVFGWRLKWGADEVRKVRYTERRAPQCDRDKRLYIYCYVRLSGTV